MCTGPGFQSDGATAELSRGTSQRQCPLGMINEAADSRHAAQLLWGVGVHGVEKGVFSPVPGSCHRGTPPPLVPDNSLALPEPGKKRAGEVALCRPHCSPASRTLTRRGTRKGRCPYCCLRTGVYLSISQPGRGKHTRPSAHSPHGWEVPSAGLTLLTVRAFATLPPRSFHKQHPL